MRSTVETPTPPLLYREPLDPPGIQFPQLGAIQARVCEVMRPTVPIVFLKLGGTWDMVIRDGRRVGSGNLDDDELLRIQEAVGLFRAQKRMERQAACKKLAGILYRQFLNTPPESSNVASHLASWCRDPRTEKTLGDYIDGPFIPLFSGDSSHLKSFLTVPMIMYILQLMLAHPTTPIKA